MVKIDIATGFPGDKRPPEHIWHKEFCTPFGYYVPLCLHRRYRCSCQYLTDNWKYVTCEKCLKMKGKDNE